MSDKKNGDRHHPTSVIPGEVALYNLLPKGWSLVSLLALGVFGTAYGYFQLQQQTKDIAALSDEVDDLASEAKDHIRRHNGGGYRQGLKK